MDKGVEPKPTMPKHIGAIETLSFNNIGFKHKSAQFKALEEINFSVKQGETIGVFYLEKIK